MRYLPSLLRAQILSNDGICLGANINKFDQMWYLLHICINFAVVVNPFFRAVKLTESAVAKQLHRHMVANDLFPVVQSSYRKFHIVMQMTANFICPSTPMPVLTKMLLWLEWKAVLMIFLIGY